MLTQFYFNSSLSVQWSSTMYTVDVVQSINKWWMQCGDKVIRVFIVKGLTCIHPHSFSLHSDWSSCMLYRGPHLGWICVPKLSVRQMCGFVFICSATSPFFICFVEFALLWKILDVVLKSGCWGGFCYTLLASSWKLLKLTYNYKIITIVVQGCLEKVKFMCIGDIYK